MNPPATVQFLPPRLIHELRARSYQRLYQMTGNPGNRGFGRYVRSRIARVVAREHTAIEKAITVAYLGSYLVDHIVNAERQACRLIEQREMTEVEEHRIWETHYPHVIRQVLGELPEAAGVSEALDRLAGYGRLDPAVHDFRCRHWRMISRMLDAGAIDEGIVFRRVQDRMASGASPAVRARAVQLAASLLADRLGRVRAEPWSEAFFDVMMDLYPLIARHPEVLERVV